MKQASRSRALALCICLLFILIASSLSVIHEADHNCIGENCPVCEHILMVIRLVRDVSLIVLFLAALILFTAGPRRFYDSASTHSLLYATPVRLKVRLND